MLTKKQFFVWGSEGAAIITFFALLFLWRAFFPSSNVPVTLEAGFTQFFRWLVVPTASLLIGIGFIMYQRFTTAAIEPLHAAQDSQRLLVGKQNLQNSLEQLVLFVFVQLSAIAIAPVIFIPLIPFFAILFLFARILFLVGYLYKQLFRAPGFGLTFYPTVFVFGYILWYLAF